MIMHKLLFSFNFSHSGPAAGQGLYADINRKGSLAILFSVRHRQTGSRWNLHGARAVCVTWWDIHLPHPGGELGNLVISGQYPVQRIARQELAEIHLLCLGKCPGKCEILDICHLSTVQSSWGTSRRQRCCRLLWWWSLPKGGARRGIIYQGYCLQNVHHQRM